jgi:hypothetical protein
MGLFCEENRILSMEEGKSVDHSAKNLPYAPYDQPRIGMIHQRTSTRLALRDAIALIGVMFPATHPMFDSSLNISTHSVIIDSVKSRESPRFPAFHLHYSQQVCA